MSTAVPQGGPAATASPLHPSVHGAPRERDFVGESPAHPLGNTPGLASALPRAAGVEAGLYSLFRLEVPVNDAQAVQVVQAQSQLSQVKLHVLLREHHLQRAGRGVSWGRLSLRS